MVLSQETPPNVFSKELSTSLIRVHEVCYQRLGVTIAEMLWLAVESVPDGIVGCFTGVTIMNSDRHRRDFNFFIERGLPSKNLLSIFRGLIDSNPEHEVRLYFPPVIRSRTENFCFSPEVYRELSRLAGTAIGAGFSVYRKAANETVVVVIRI